MVRRFDQGNNLNSRKRSLAASLVIEGTNTHETVGAGLDRKGSVGVRGLDLKGRGLQASFFCVGRIHNLRRIPVALCPTQVHAQQDLSEISSIHAASAASDGDDCVALVIFTVKKSANLKGGHIVLQGGKVRFGLGKNIFRVRRIALCGLTGHVNNRLEVVNAFFHCQNTIEFALAVRQL